MKSKPILTSSSKPSRTRSDKLATWKKSRARIIVPSEDSLKWRAGRDTTRHTWRPGKLGSKEERKRRELPLTQETQSTDQDWRPFSDQWGPFAIMTERKRSRTGKLSSEMKWKPKSWPCGAAKSINSCSIWLNLKTKSSRRCKQESNSQLHMKAHWIRESINSIKRQASLLITH